MASTGVARLSLASATPPATRTDHAINIRARTTSGSGTIRAALYEGTTDRSGTIGATLTTSFAWYVLPIGDSGAAAISSYSDLEVRVWGYSASAGVVFEVAEVFLMVPAAGASTTRYGAVVTPLVASVVTSGVIPGSAKQTGVARLSLAAGVDPGVNTGHTIVLRARLVSGSGKLRAALYEGASNRSGDLESSTLSSSFADYSLAIPEASAANITSYSDLELRVWGYHTSAVGTFEIASLALSTPNTGGIVQVGLATETSAAAAVSIYEASPPIYPGESVYPSEAYGGDLGGLQVGIAVETATAPALGSTGGAVVVTLGIAAETATAHSLKTPFIYAVGIATESSSAPATGALGGAAVIVVGIATEWNVTGLVGGSGALVTRAVIRDGSEDLVIGARMTTTDPSYTYDGYFRGVLDELALLGGAISDQEVQDLYSRFIHSSTDGAGYNATTGIWVGTTNLLPNGGLEGGITGWSAVNGATLSQSATDPLLGAYSLKIVTDAQDEGATSASVTTVVSQTHTGSVWVRGSGVIRLELEERTGADSLVGTTNGTEVSLEGSAWKRVSVSRTFGGTGAKARLRVIGRSSVATIYAEGLQLEQQVVPTPYVETNGATAARSGARMQVPASYLDESQGWVAARIRLGWGNTSEPGEAKVFDWRDSTSALLSLYYNVTTNSFVMRRTDGVSPAEATVARAIAVSDRVTLIAAWTAAGVKLSVDGAPFTSASGTGVPALTATFFDLGSQGGSSGHLNGDFIWFACGTGTLTDTDAETLFDWNDEPPRLHTYPAAALVKLAWDGVDDWALEAGHTHALAQGRLRRIFHNPGSKRSSTEFELIDQMERLSTEMGILLPAPSEYMGEAIARVLERIGMEDPSLQDLDAGEAGLTRVQNDGTTSWLQTIADIVLSDMGMFIINAEGHAVFRERRSRPLASYRGRLSRELRALQPGVDIDRVVNTWNVEAADHSEGVESLFATAGFARSQRRYGVRYSQYAAKHLATSDQAYSLAEHLVRRSAEPDAPVYAVTMTNRSDRQLALALGLEVGDMLGIFGKTTIGYYIVEQISVSADVQEGRHEVSLVVSTL